MCGEDVQKKKSPLAEKRGTHSGILEAFSCSTHEVTEREKMTSCWRRAEVNWISVSIERIEKLGREGESRCMSTH